MPCTTDEDCEPPYTKCDEAYGRCVDGCFQVPCHKGYSCDVTSGDCVRDDSELHPEQHGPGVRDDPGIE